MFALALQTPFYCCIQRVYCLLLFLFIAEHAIQSDGAMDSRVHSSLIYLCAFTKCLLMAIDLSVGFVFTPPQQVKTSRKGKSNSPDISIQQTQSDSDNGTVSIH